MTDRLHVNHSTHCELCQSGPGAGNRMRVQIGDLGGQRRLAVCPVHDIAGPVAALPDSLRRALTP